MNPITILMSSRKTVFTTADINNLLDISTKRGVERFLRRAKKDGRLLNPRKGIRTLPVYDMNELAGTLFADGYISLEPVLFEAGVSFQYMGNTRHCIRHKNADIYFNEQNYVAKVMKKSLYENPLCIQKYNGYRKAMPERALCDLVYLRPQAQFDNPQYFQNPQSEARLKKLLPLYPKTTQKHVTRLIATQI